MLERIRKEGKTPVIFLSDSLLKNISRESKEKLLSSISETGLKIYSDKNISSLLNIKRAYVFRYGDMGDRIISKLRGRGSIVVPGDF